MFIPDDYIDGFADELDPTHVPLYDLFVSEYEFDRSEIKAAIRCGFSRDFAIDRANLMLNTPYVQQELKRRASLPLNPESLKINVVYKLKALLDSDDQKVQIAASGKLMDLLGLNAPTKTEQSVTHLGGVMKLPGIATIEEWENVAAPQQKALMSDNTEDAA